MPSLHRRFRRRGSSRTTANQLASHAVQARGAIVARSPLTILPPRLPSRRPAAVSRSGIWGGSAACDRDRPAVAAAVVTVSPWNWIFGPPCRAGLVLCPPRVPRLRGTSLDSSLDRRGRALSARAVRGIVWGLVRVNQHGWSSIGIVFAARPSAQFSAPRSSGGSRTQPRCCLFEFFRTARSQLANIASAAHVRGMFGFDLLSRAVLPDGCSTTTPLSLGCTSCPDAIASYRAARRRLSDPCRRHRLMAGGSRPAGDGLAWIAAVSTPTMPTRPSASAPCALRHRSWRLFFVARPNVVLSSVRPDQRARRPVRTRDPTKVGGVFASPSWRPSFA